jgi:orotate phosphoribosyltransferase
MEGDMLKDKLAAQRQSWRDEISYLAASVLRDIVVVATPHGLDGGIIVKEQYLDFDLTIRDPVISLDVCQLYVDVIMLIRTKLVIDGLAFIKKDDAASSNTIGAIQLATLITTHREVQLPHIVVRLDKDIPHERVKFHNVVNYSSLLDGKSFVIITDHISRGFEILDTISSLESYGGRVAAVISFTRRRDIFAKNEHVKQELGKKNIELYCLYEAWVENDHSGEQRLIYNENSDLFNRLKELAR